MKLTMIKTLRKYPCFSIFFSFIDFFLIVIFVGSMLITLPSFATEISLTGEPLGSFTMFVSKQTGKTIVLPDDRRTMPVSLVGSYNSFPQLFELYRQTLDVNRFKLVLDEGVYKVFDKSPEDYLEGDSELLTKVLKFSHIGVDRFLRDMGTLPQGISFIKSLDSLIIRGPQDSVDMVVRLAGLSDIDRKQVLIEVGVIESSDTNNKEIGLALQTALVDTGFISSFNDISKAGVGLGAAFSYMSGGNLRAFLNLVATNEHVDVLSRPELLVLDREQAYITVGQNVPFIGSTETNQNGIKTQNIVRKDVGLSVRIHPQVIGNRVRLVINQELSNVTNSTAASDVITNQRALSTTVILESGTSVMLGGLVSSESEGALTQVPGLSKIPYVGKVFQSTKNIKVRRDLKLVVKATVI